MGIIKSPMIQGGIYQYAQDTGYTFDLILNDRSREMIAARAGYYLMLRRAGYTFEQIALITGRLLSAVHRSVTTAERRLDKADPLVIKYFKIAKNIGVIKNEIKKSDYVPE